MSWASNYIEQLRQGETVKFRPRGNSMSGKIENGQLVTVEPVIQSTELEPGMIVLCRVKGQEYLHLIKAAKPNGMYLIGNNRGKTNGWISRSNIYGVCINVES